MNLYHKNAIKKICINAFYISLLLPIILSCSKTDSFDESSWKSNSDINIKYNPRAEMVSDLINNHLRIGMSRSKIIEIIGLPYKEDIEYRLPENLKIPDSISIETSNTMNKSKAINSINGFYRLHAKKDTIMMYNIGWSTIDPKFLTIKLNGYGKVKSFILE